MNNTIMFFDAPFYYQMNLQDSATYGMSLIVQLHNYVMLIDVAIVILVIYFFFEIIATTIFKDVYHYQTEKLNESFGFLIYLRTRHSMKHMPILEILWTIFPVIALITIALPSLSMLYYFSLSFSPSFIVNVIGHQWYWTYEFALPTSASSSDILFTHYFGYILKNHCVHYNKTFFMFLNDLDSYYFFKEEGTAEEMFNFKTYLIRSQILLNFYPDYAQFNTNDSGMRFLKAYEIAHGGKKNSMFNYFTYDSIMVSTDDLFYGGCRLLEVDNPLFLPINVPVRVIVTADDVIHSWAIPSLGVKIDCIPGRLNVVEFVIARGGIFYGQCSEICGTQHGFMPICIVAIPLDVFQFLYNK